MYGLLMANDVDSTTSGIPRLHIRSFQNFLGDMAVEPRRILILPRFAQWETRILSCFELCELQSLMSLSRAELSTRNKKRMGRDKTCSGLGIEA